MFKFKEIYGGYTQGLDITQRKCTEGKRVKNGEDGDIYFLNFIVIISLVWVQKHYLCNFR